MSGETVTDGEPDSVAELRTDLETLTEGVSLLEIFEDAESVGVVVSVTVPI